MRSCAPFRAGVVALLGPANAGKSTLVNALVGTRIALVSRRAQSTRERLLAVVNRPFAQIVLADSPGIHQSRGRVLNRALNLRAGEIAAGADVLLFVTEAGRWTAGDERVLDLVRAAGKPAVRVLNKIDRVRPRPALLPLIEEAARQHDFAAIVPVSARRGENLDRLLAAVEPLLPESLPLFPPGELSDRGPSERAAETVREALIERLGDELPYATYVAVERYARVHGRIEIDATIWVARESQKGIVVGAGGRMAKAIGTAARRRLEADLGRPVMLRLRVRLRSRWNEDARVLAELGLSG